jgi:hypothetical protein
MNLVGKIFVFLILVMSLCFAMLAVGVYMTQTNWRDAVVRADGWENELKKAREDTEKLKKEKLEQENQFKTQIAAKQQALIKSETENVNLAANYEDAKKKYALEVGNHEKALAELNTSQKRLGELQIQIAGVKNEVNGARTEIDKLFKQTTILTEENHQWMLKNRNLQITRDRLQKQVENATVLLAPYGKNVDSEPDRKDIVLAGVVTGVVVKDRTTLVQLSIGSDDGLTMNHRLKVFRGSTPLGEVVIIRTEPDKAVGRVERPLGQIQVRDQVETKRSLMQTAGVQPTS